MRALESWGFARERPRPYGADRAQEGQIVTLSNGQVAILRQVTPEGVVIDCNHPLAGAPLKINLKVLQIDRPPADMAAAP